jgi:hypothetical protein
VRPRGRSSSSLRAALLLIAGAIVASLAFVASGLGGPTAAHGFKACKDSRGYLFVPASACRAGSEVVWDGEIPAVAIGAKSLTKDAIVQVHSDHTFGETVKDGGGWKRTKRYVAKCPLEYVAVAGSFNVEWDYVYDVDIVASRSRAFQGASAWEVLAVKEGASTSAPQAIVNVVATCIARTAIFPGG